jgi:inorganic phosphate transporter, PiT family
MGEYWWVVAVVALGLSFEFVNGFHDAANAIATSVLTRALSIRNAVVLCALLNFIGALSSTAVAATMGKGLVDPSDITSQVVVTALIGAIVWDLITWHFGLPTSSTHAIVGGVIGAAAAYKGFGIIHWAGTKKVMLGLIISPLAGIIVAFILMILFLWIFGRRAPARLNRNFRYVQILSAGAMAFSHGQNDGQKSMGIITMALLSGGLLAASADGAFHVPPWVMLSCAAAMGLGSGAGGWKIIKTLGRNVMELQPIHGCVAELTAAGLILTASHVGAPISTTHVVSSAIMGVGMTKRLSAVKWKVAGRILSAWIFTMPASGAISYAAMLLVKAFI